MTEVCLLGFLPDAGTYMQIGVGLLGAGIVVLALARPTRRHFGVGSSRL